jgi:serine/threonine protein kinase
MSTTDQEAFASADGGTAEETLNPTLLSAPPLLGTTLNERYLIEREIKRGGFGVVYLARDKQLHSRPVVVKVLLEEALQNEWIVGKFRQEIEALSRIDHPGIVGIIDAGELPDGKPYLVMEYVDGSTLRSVMTPEGVSFERAAALLKQISRALTAAHDKGILHRDLKPENIMLRDLGHGEEQVKIIDFGIAKVRNSVLAPSTVTTNIAGTISYMAPEQLSARPVSAATDTYALGSIAYEMLTGRRPFNPETSFQLLELQRAGVRVKPIDLRPGLPEEAEEVILKALSFEPRDRYQSASELGDALAHALTGEVPTLELRRRSNAQILPTQLSTETIPRAAQTAGEAPAKTLAVSFEPAQAITPPSDMAASMPAPPSRFSIWLNTPWLKFAVSFVFLVAVVTAFYGVFTLRSSNVPNAANTTSNRSAAPATYATAERALVYSLTVQKFHNGVSYDQPFETSGQEIFENGWKFKMNISSPQEGYLYLLNEGPGANGGTTYNVLFPEPKTNGGSPRVTTDQKLQTAWMKFDEHQGTEKFWIVWSGAPVKEFDDVTGVVNAKQKGEITDAAQAKAVRDFLEEHSSPKPEVAKDSAGEKTTVTGKGDVLVSNVELKHH